MTAEEQIKTYVVLKYGDDRELLLNPNCTTRNFVNFIKDKCICEKEATIDLCDENGRLRYLHDQAPDISATLCLQDKATYVPVIIQKNEENGATSYEPLLNESSLLFASVNKGLQQQHSQKRGRHAKSGYTQEFSGAKTATPKSKRDGISSDQSEVEERSPVRAKGRRR